MSAAARRLLRRLAAAGLRLTLEGNRLRVSGPRGALTRELLEEIRREKGALVVALRGRGNRPGEASAPGNPPAPPQTPQTAQMTSGTSGPPEDRIPAPLLRLRIAAARRRAEKAAREADAEAAREAVIDECSARFDLAGRPEMPSGLHKLLDAADARYAEALREGKPGAALRALDDLRAAFLTWLSTTGLAGEDAGLDLEANAPLGLLYGLGPGAKPGGRGRLGSGRGSGRKKRREALSPRERARKRLEAGDFLGAWSALCDDPGLPFELLERVSGNFWEAVRRGDRTAAAELVDGVLREVER